MRRNVWTIVLASSVLGSVAFAQSPAAQTETPFSEQKAAARTAQAPAALSLVQQVRPVYPDDARKQRVQGVVSLHVLIGVDGAIKELSVLSGPPALMHSALEAVRQWRYQPYMQNGKAVEVATTVNLNFKLDGEAPTSGPFSTWMIVSAIASGKPLNELAGEIKQRGTDSYFDEGDVQCLQMLGASEEIFNALRTARYIWVDHSADPPKLKAELAQAEVEFQTLAANRPDAPALHFWLGWILRAEGKNVEAISELRKALALRSDIADAHRSLGEALYVSGKKEEAISELREGVRLHPNSSGPHYTLGDALYSSGDHQGGLAELREAVRVAPDYYDAHTKLGYLLLSEKSLDDAIREFREALRLNPKYEPSHTGLGWAFYAKHDYSASVVEYREAMHLNPRDADARTWLAAALYQTGQFEDSATEARVALLYDPKEQGVKNVLSSAKSKLGETAAPVAGAQVVQTAQSTSSEGIAGSTWACQLVVTDQNGTGNWSLSFTFLEDGTAKVMNTQYGNIFYDYPPKWQLNGSSITILTSQEHNGDDFVGTMNGQTSMTLRVVGRWVADSGSLTCNRLTPLPPPPQPVAQAQPSPNHPPYDDKCLRTGQGNLGSVTITNICTQPIDLKFCYRKQGDSGSWTCTVTPRLEPNHTLQSPFCNQCAYDGRAAAYLSSRNLLGSLPSDAEVASWTGSGPPPGQNSSASGGQGSSDGQRQWHFVNPAQNWDTLTFEIRGRNGDSTSDDWNDEATLRTVTLKPGESWTQDCGSYFSLDIKWQLASASDPQVDTFFDSLVCYANNFVWTNNHNLREYDFPRQ